VAYRVFISHASRDQWVAGQIAKELHGLGISYFLDSEALETGDQLDVRLRDELNTADELLVLLTPAALARPYVLMEMGAAWNQEKRIVGILYGVTSSELAGYGTPAFITNLVLRDINEFERYIREVEQRLRHG